MKALIVLTLLTITAAAVTLQDNKTEVLTCHFASVADTAPNSVTFKCPDGEYRGLYDVPTDRFTYQGCTDVRIKVSEGVMVGFDEQSEGCVITRQQRKCTLVELADAACGIRPPLGSDQCRP